MKAKTITGTSVEEIQKGLQDNISDDFSPTLAIVFCSSDFDYTAIITMINAYEMDIFGATAGGQVIDGKVEAESAVILLLELNRDYYKVLIEEADENTVLTGARNLGKRGIEAFSNPAFIISFSDGYLPGELLIAGLKESVPTGTTILGGCSSDDMTFVDSRVFTSHDVYHKAIIGLVIDADRISLEGLVVSGWKPIGTTRTITACKGPWVMTIDNIPAYDILNKYLGFEVDEEQATSIYWNMGLNHPWQIERPGRSPMMIPPISINIEEKSCLLPQPLPTGTRFKFTVPPDFEFVTEVAARAQEVKDQKLAEADALIVFSCTARLSALGPLMDEELNGLHDVWSAPSVGLFCYGEFGSLKNSEPEFHGTTCSWVALKEK
jgi:hypothetical protein